MKITKNPTTFRKGSFITIPSPAELENTEETTYWKHFLSLLLFISLVYFSF